MYILESLFLGIIAVSLLIIAGNIHKGNPIIIKIQREDITPLPVAIEAPIDEFEEEQEDVVRSVAEALQDVLEANADE